MATLFLNKLAGAISYSVLALMPVVCLAANPSGRTVPPAVRNAVVASPPNCLVNDDAGNQHNEGVHPPCSKPYGRSYGEWSANWWRWLWSVPPAVNPILDDTGAHCAEGQSGPVWYLVGTFGGPAVRTCTIPAGVSILIPIFNVAYGDGYGDCNGNGPFHDPNLPGCFDPGVWESLTAFYSSTMDNPTLEVTIDGRSLAHLNSYRARSAQFSYRLGPDNILGHPAGTYSPLVADGYWIMTTPLSRGLHTIHFMGAAGPGPFEGFSVDVTYFLTVR